jgi:hypothetical protein
LFVTAPLVKAAGGAGKCSPAVYANADDADYRAVLTLVESAVEKTWANPRRDLQSLSSPTPRSEVARN